MINNCYLNDTAISSDIINFNNTNETMSFEKTYYNLNFNTISKGNNIYFTFAYSGGSNSNIIVLEYIKVEIFAPNANILCKNNTFDAWAFNGNYYLTDCVNSNLKIANIDANAIYSINNVNWINTNYNALFCKTCGSFTRYDNVVMPNEIRYFVYNNKYKYWIGNENNFEISSPSYAAYDFVEYADNLISFLGVRNTDGKMYKSYYVPSEDTMYNVQGKVIADLIQMIGARYLNCSNMATNYYPCVTIHKDGSCYMRASIDGNSKNILIGYGSDATLYITDFVSNTNYKAVVFLKKYDKIIRYDYKYVSSGYTLLSTTEIGSYEKFFLMPNNDYFVVKNNGLRYHKFNND